MRSAALQRGRRRSSPEGTRRSPLPHGTQGSFNGAGDVHRRKGWRPSLLSIVPVSLQRGRRRSSPEGSTPASRSSRGRRGFNGAGDVHRRKEPARSSAPCCTAGFNGAGDVHRRKDSNGLPHRTPSGQLQRGRRRSSPEGRCARGEGARRRSRFNGAGDVHRRKVGWLPPPPSSPRCASTGPATFIAGRGHGARDRLSSSHRFNGAGDVHRRKGGAGSPTRRCATSFNGAGDVHRRKVRAAGPDAVVDWLLQRGRRRSSPEGLVWEQLARAAETASTGPATFIAGR